MLANKQARDTSEAEGRDPEMKLRVAGTKVTPDLHRSRAKV